MKKWRQTLADAPCLRLKRPCMASDVMHDVTMAKARLVLLATRMWYGLGSMSRSTDRVQQFQK